MHLALYLIQAEATDDPVWGQYLNDFERCPFKPVILWSDDSLQELQGTQVLDTALQYRCGMSLFGASCTACQSNLLQQPSVPQWKRNRTQTAALCREFFKAKHAQLDSTVLPELDDATRSACSLQRFMLAAAAVRARLFPPYSNQEPCVAAGIEVVRDDFCFDYRACAQDEVSWPVQRAPLSATPAHLPRT